MKLKLGFKKCLWCKKRITLKINRDLKRKRFCSYACRQKWRYKNGEWTMNRMWKKCNTPEANKKKALKGKRHPCWIKDRSLIKDKRFHNSPEGKIWRLAVFERDKFICQYCRQKGGKLRGHHIKSFRNYPKLRMDINNGITLCIKCHNRLHKKINPRFNPEQ